MRNGGNKASECSGDVKTKVSDQTGYRGKHSRERSKGKENKTRGWGAANIRHTSNPFQGCNFSRKRRFLFGFGFLPLINEQSALFSLQPSSQLSRTCNLTVEIDQ